MTVIAVARNAAPLQRLAQRLGPQLLIEVRDRGSVDATCLQMMHATHTGLFSVADASGPFQSSDDRLPRAAIAAGLHYVDLADGRAFVGDIGKLHDAALAASVAVMAGASSTPALSHAVLDTLVADAHRVVAIDVSIAPGNRAPRGLSVVQSILSTVGQPVDLFRGGRWTQAAGWTLGKTITLPDVGSRRVVLCETPDLDLLVTRYRPATDAMFRAGLELRLLQDGVALLGLLVRGGLVRTLLPLARPLRALADLFKPFGSDHGGMQVDVLVEMASGALVRRVWTLTARSGIGPYVPTLPALAALRMLADDTLRWRGAAPCAGLVPYDIIAREFAHYGIRTVLQETVPQPSLMKRLLGHAWEELPATIQQAHDVHRVLVLEGRADAISSPNPVARLFAWLFRFPRNSENMPLRVEMRSEDDGSETWTRFYPDVTMRSNLRNVDPASRQLDEVFGPVAIRLQWEVTEQGLALSAIGAKLFGIPLPGFLRPRSKACESVGRDGRFHFDVDIAMPMIGAIVSYSGYLQPADDHVSAN
jgi:hypothetical protein